MIVVVDASVAVKWFLPEPFSEVAARLLDASCELVAPDLMRLEVGSAFLKALRRGVIGPSDAAGALMRLSDPLVRFEPVAPFVDDAFALAERYGGSLYDAVYIRLAETLGATLATNDRELAQTAIAANVEVWHVAEPGPAFLEL